MDLSSIKQLFEKRDELHSLRMDQFEKSIKDQSTRHHDQINNMIASIAEQNGWTRDDIKQTNEIITRLRGTTLTFIRWIIGGFSAAVVMASSVLYSQIPLTKVESHESRLIIVEQNLKQINEDYCIIKGNIQVADRIYHVKGESPYWGIVKEENCFVTEKEAIENGFRKYNTK